MGFTWVKASFALTVAALGFNVLLITSYSSAAQQLQSQGELLRSQTEVISQLKQDLRRRLAPQPRSLVRSAESLNHVDKALSEAMITSSSSAAQQLQSQRELLRSQTELISQLKQGLQRRVAPQPAGDGMVTDQAQNRSCGALPTRTSAERPEPEARAASQVVVGGTVRFTVLTEGTLRIERATEPHVFDERATFTVVNRRLEIPPFTAVLEKCRLLPDAPPGAHCLAIETSLVRLEYLAVLENGSPEASLFTSCLPGHAGRLECRLQAQPLNSSTLQVELQLLPSSGRRAQWWPGKPNPTQLPGTVRTLDKVQGSHSLQCDELPNDATTGEHDQHCAMGVVSRSGWVLLDDTHTVRFDGSGARGGWDWAAPVEGVQAVAPSSTAADTEDRCGQWAGSGECVRNKAFMAGACATACWRLSARSEQLARGESKVDWYLLARGLDFKAALFDYALLSGPQPMPPRFAFGVWFSR